MHPEPSIPAGLAHLAAELFGSLFVVAASFGLIAAVVLIGGGTGGGAEDRLVGFTLATLGLPLFLFGRFLIGQHGVSRRRPDDDEGGGGGGGPHRPILPRPPAGPSLRERHVAARRRPDVAPAPRRPTSELRPKTADRSGV